MKRAGTDATAADSVNALMLRHEKHMYPYGMVECIDEILYVHVHTGVNNATSLMIYMLMICVCVYVKHIHMHV